MGLFFAIIYGSFLIWIELIPIKLLLVLIKPQGKNLKSLGMSLRKILPKMGPAFVKLAQFLSIREDLLPKILCQELAFLQDKAPTIATKKIKQIIEKTIGCGIIIEEEPLAAASIAQVHRATIGEALVVVKVLRPGIRNAFEKNLSFLLFLAKIANKILSEAKRLRLIEVVELLIETSKIELDLELEGAAADKLRFNSRNREGLVIPKIFWDFTSKDCLVMEWIDGSKLNDTSGILRKKLAETLAINFFQQVYLDGFFHADLHWGNLLVDQEENLVLIDFGLNSFLPERDRFYLAEMIYAFLQKDYERVSELHFELGYLEEDTLTRRNLFSLACRTIAEPIFGKNNSEIPITKLLKRLFQITADFKMKTQPQLLLLQKNLISLEGIVRKLNPEINLWELLEPLFKDWANKNLNIFATSKRKIHKLIEKLTKDLDLN
jgi:ubiquinone biosynthesis protein